VTTLGINAVGTRHSGAATVLRALVEGLLAASDRLRLVLFLSPAAERRFELPLSERIDIVQAPSIAGNPLGRYLWLGVRFRNLVRSHGCDAVIHHNNLGGPSNAFQLLFLQQSLYFSGEAMERMRPHSWSTARRYLQPRIWRHLMRVSARMCDAVVVQTETMKAVTVRELGLDPRAVIVIPPPRPQIDRRPSNPSSGSSARILYIGSAAAYKNVLVILDAARLALSAGRSWQFELTIPGAAGAPENAMFLGEVAPERLADRLAGASAVVMPSLTETVGLPMLESMVCGVPVVAADRPYAHEICGDSCLFFDPGSGASLYEALARVIDSPELARRLSARGRARVQAFPEPASYARFWLDRLWPLHATADRSLAGEECK
jgi:glycosyltransferase involved in cell wall biosynthesis